MKTSDIHLKVQALEDGELPPAEAREIATLVEKDPELQTLRSALRETRKILVAHEPAHPLPETREFYWSKIQRAIKTPSRAPASIAERLHWWMRLALPVSAALALIAVVMLKPGYTESAPVYLATGHVVETPIDEMSSITFRSESARMTVVWVDANLN